MRRSSPSSGDGFLPGVRVPVAGEADGLVAVQVLEAGLEVHEQVPPMVVVVHLVLDVHVHAAQGIHHLLGGINVQHQIVRGIGAQEFVDRGDRAVRPAGLVSRIDLKMPVGFGADDVGVGVARDGQHGDFVGVQVHREHEQRVGPGLGGVDDVAVGPVVVNAHADDGEPVHAGEALFGGEGCFAQFLPAAAAAARLRSSGGFCAGTTPIADGEDEDDAQDRPQGDFFAFAHDNSRT